MPGVHPGRGTRPDDGRLRGARARASAIASGCSPASRSVASSASSSLVTGSRSRSPWRSSGGASASGRAVASVDGEVACEALLLVHHPAGRQRSGEPAATRGARRHPRQRGRPRGRPRGHRQAQAGPHAVDGRPRAQRTSPGAGRAPRARAAGRGCPRRSRATRTWRSPTSTMRRRSRGWRRSRRRTVPPPTGRASSSPTMSSSICAACRRSGGCGADETLVLVCHGSPGSQTGGLSADLDPSITVERVTRTDARVICCGHTHVADTRELGRKLIVNPGSCGVRVRRRPGRVLGACITLDDEMRPVAGALLRPAVRRAGGDRGGRRPRTRRRRVSGRHDPHRAGSSDERHVPRRAARRDHRHGRGHATRQRRGDVLVAPRLRASRGVRTIDAFDPSRVTSKIAGEVRDFDRQPCARSQGDAPQRPQHPVRARRDARGDGRRRACRSGSKVREAEQTGVLIGSGLGGSGTLVEQIAHQRDARARPAVARSSSRCPSPTWPPGRRP